MLVRFFDFALTIQDALKAMLIIPPTPPVVGKRLRAPDTSILRPQSDQPINTESEYDSHSARKHESIPVEIKEEGDLVEKQIDEVLPGAKRPRLQEPLLKFEAVDDNDIRELTAEEIPVKEKIVIVID
jgi:hypothetical protein